MRKQKEMNYLFQSLKETSDLHKIPPPNLLNSISSFTSLIIVMIPIIKIYDCVTFLQFIHYFITYLKVLLWVDGMVLMENNK